jgi:hypothetical protein
MRRILIITAAVLALAGAAAVSAATPKQTAEQMCSSLRSSLGSTTFGQTYGTNASRSNAFGQCLAKLEPLALQDLTTANQQCRAEQNDTNFPASHNGKTFAQFYGTGNLKNAFGRCVSMKAKAQEQGQEQAIVNAARQCKAERSANPAAFKNKYGTNANKSNAFGKCVSAKAKL